MVRSKRSTIFLFFDGLKPETLTLLVNANAHITPLSELWLYEPEARVGPLYEEKIKCTQCCRKQRNIQLEAEKQNRLTASR